jgi:photosystem II stability/assembly factor-like uncharacterized protein
MALLVSTRAGLFLRDGEAEAIFHTDFDFMALAAAPSDPRVCYAARVDGQVYRSENGGHAWDAVGRIDGFEELSCLAVDPRDPDWLLAGMEPSALFLSRDGGRTWREDPRIPEMARLERWSVPWSDALGHVRAASIDPNNPKRVYLAIEVGGVVRSENGGETWESVHGGIHDDVHTVAVNPWDGSVVYAATRHGFGRSEDYGATWRRIDAFPGTGYCRPLAVDPRDPRRVFTASAPVTPDGFRRPEGSECRIFRSEDGGLSWTHLSDGLPDTFHAYVDGLAVDPERPRRVALADSEGHLYHREDGGDTWRPAGQLPAVRRLIFLG